MVSGVETVTAAAEQSIGDDVVHRQLKAIGDLSELVHKQAVLGRMLAVRVEWTFLSFWSSYHYHWIFMRHNSHAQGVQFVVPQ